MRRRALLSAGVTVAAAGCLGPVFGTDCPRGTDLRLVPVTDADVASGSSDPLDSLSMPERRAFRSALDGAGGGDGGSGGRESDGGDAGAAPAPTLWGPESSHPFGGVDYLAVGGAYYTVETPVVSAVARPAYPFDLDAGENVDSGGRAVAFADLPPVDRTALFAALGYPSPAEIDRFDRARAIGIGGTLAYPDADAESRSELVPDPAHAYLRIGGRDFRFRVDEPRTVTVATRRVTVRRVASSTAAFAALARERYGIDLDARDLSAEQREIVETAIEEGYDECAPYSDAYAALQRSLGRGGVGQGTVVDTPSPDVPNEVEYAKYGGEWYAVELSTYVA